MSTKGKIDLSNVLRDLPPLVARRDIPRLLPGIISKGRLANLDSQGRGPKRLLLGGIIVYTRESLVEFFNNRVQEVN